MNRFFRLVWSRHHGALVAIPENRTAPSGRGRRARRAASALAALLMGGTAAEAQDIAATALPNGGTVTAGQADIAVTAPGRMQIDQASDRAVVEWDRFDVGAEAAVSFDQPGRGSAVLNRVTGAAPSQIFGQITANGQVFVTNRNGVYFSPGARVDVGGLVATTHGLSDDRFMARDLTLERDGAEGSVVNDGRLTAADGGYIGLLAPEVVNEGVVTARLGTVALGAGESFRLEIDDAGGLAGLQVEAGEIDTLVENGGALVAPGGRVILSAGAAQDLRSGVVRNSGTIEAQGIREAGGRIFLGGARVETTSTSRIAASLAPDRSARPLQRPTEAQVHVEADEARLSGTLSADGSTGGVVAVEAERITLDAGARLAAMGEAAGGAVLVGGDWQGGANATRRVFGDPDAMRQARFVEMNAGALIDVSSATGAGGTAVLWSEVGRGGTTLAWGEIRAEGVTGGQVETSGFALDVAGSSVSTRAFDGTAGDWLLDPGDITIETGGAAAIPGLDGPSGDVIIAPATIEAALATNNVTVTTGATGDFTLIVEDSIAYLGTDERTLTFGASGRLFLRPGASITSGSAPLNVVLAAEIDRPATSGTDPGRGVTVEGDIDTNGGDLWIGGGQLTGTWNGHTVGTGIAMGGGDSNQNAIDFISTVTTDGGDVWIGGGSSNSNAGPLVAHSAASIDAGAGDVTLVVDRLEFGGPGNNLTIDTTGGLTIAPADTSFETAVVWNPTSGGGYYESGTDSPGHINGLRISDTLSGFTLGGPGNTADVTVSSPLTVAGPVTIEGGAVSLGADVTTASGNGDIEIVGRTSLLATGPDRALNSGGGDITIRTDEVLHSGPDVVIQSTGQFTFQPVTNWTTDFVGGNVLQFDGSMSGADFVGDGGLPELRWLRIDDFASLSGFALGRDGSSNGLSIEAPIAIAGPVTLRGSGIILNADVSTLASGGAGITLAGTSIAQAAGVSVSTGGADVSYTVASGAATAATDQLIHLDGDAGGAGLATIDAGGGDIALSATFAGGGVEGGNDRPLRFDDAVLQTSGAGTITLTGDMSVNPTQGSAYGMEFFGATLRTGDGAILLDGTGGFASPNSRGIVVDGRSAYILSDTGAITLVDRQPAGLTGTYTGFYLEPGSPGAVAIGADGSTVASSASDVTIRADRATFDTRISEVTTTGDFVLEPLGPSFGAGIATANLGLTGIQSGIRIGSDTNTADVTLDRALSSSGDITVTGGSVTVSEALSYGAGLTLAAATTDVIVNAPLSGTGTGGAVTLRAGRHVQLGPTAQITATGATDTTLVADTDLSTDGIVLIESAGVATAGGALTFGDAVQTATIDGQTVRVGGDVFFQRGSAQSLTTGGGDLSIYGETIVANTSGLSVTTGGGNAHLFGLLNSGNAYTFVDRTGQATSGSWSAARTDALNGTDGGAAVGDSYLVTITSRLENSIAGLVANYRGAWIGAWRPDLTAYGWTWADGPEADELFFEQSGSGPGGGGSALTGFYSNFGPGEPNGALGAGGEGRAQFFGDVGLWNDLVDDTTYSANQDTVFSVLGFVRETNLAPSPLTIDTGAGTLTVEGGIGTRTPFATLDVTAGQAIVNGEGIATTGAQDFSGGLDVDGGTDPVRLAASAITAGGEVEIDGGAISLQADLSSGASAGAGITVAGTSIAQAAGVEVTTAGGDIAYTASGLVATGGSDNAIALMGDRLGAGAVRIDAGGGHIALGGSFAAGGVVGNPDRGISATGAVFVTTGTGTISLTGDATANPNTAGITAWGIQLSDVTFVTEAGDITLSGTGGAVTDNSRGIAVDNGALSVLSASGAITLTDATPVGLTGTYTGMYLRPSGAGDIALGADGATVPMSTSDVAIRADRATFDILATEVTTTGGFVLEPLGTSFGAGIDTANLALDAGARSARLGKAGNTGDITIGRALTLDGDIAILGGTLSIGQAVSATDGAPTPTLGDVTLAAASAATQAAPITAAGLSLQGGGDFTITHAGNAVGTLAAGSGGSPVGTLSFVNGGALEIGTVGAASGVTATGALAISTTSGDLSVSQSVSTTDTSTDALVLNAGSAATAGTATGGNLVFSDGATIGTGAGGRARLFSGSIAGSTGLAGRVGLGSGNFRYNADETTDFSGAGWTDIGTSGTFGIYRERPVANVADMTLSMTYGDALPGISATGLVNDDAASYDIADEVVSGAGRVTVAGSPYTIDSTLPGLGYSVTGISSGTLTVAPRGITVTGLSGVDRAYDGTTDATLSGMAALSGLLAGDAVSPTGTASGTFADANAGADVAMSLTGLGLGGADAGNYALSLPTLNADILPRVVGLSATRSYDGTTDLTGSVTITTGVSGETLGYSGAVAASARVAGPDGDTGTPDNTFTSIVLQDGTGLASNYALPAFDPGTAPVTITPRMVTAALSASGVDRPYDGTANAAPEFVPVFEFSGLAAGDTGLALSYGSASYDSADVLAATTLTVDGLAIDGVSGTLGSAPSDYALAATTAVAPAAVTPAPLTVTARNDAKFVTQADSPGFEGVRFEGFAPGETAADLGGALAVTRSNAGQEAAGVYADVLVPTGLTSSNYAITFLPGDYTIVPSDQLLIEVADQSHVYGSETPYVLERVSYFDGTGEVRLDDGSVPGAAASVSSGNLVSVDDGVGGAVAFSLSPENAGLSGAGLIPAGSYQVALVGSVSGNSANFSDVITVIGGHDVAPRDLTPSAAGGVRKVYDGTTAMTNVTIDLATPEAGDDVTVSGAGAFSDPDAGTGKTYTVSGVTLSGADAANYRLSSGASFSGNDGVITPRTLLVTWAGVDRVYDGTADASVTTTDDRKSGDDLTIARSASFADKNAGTDRPVSITGVGLSGADAGNYVVAPTGATTASITRLDSVNWVGGPSGDWFDPDNWTDGAVPDLSNVAAVIIPAGVRVTFGTSVVPPAEPGPVNVESLGTAGTLVQTGGTLNVWSGGVTLEGYEQSGGTLGVAGDARLGSFTRTGGNADILGDLAVSGTLEQTGGRLAVTGSVDAGTLVQTGGDAGVGGDLNVTGGLEQADGALAVSGDVSAGSLSQTGGDADIGGDLDVARGFDQTGPGTIRIAGRADLTDGAGGMSIGNLTVGGGLAATSTGGPIVQEPGTTILVAGTTDLAAATGGVPADIDLGGPRNDFGGPLTARAGGLFIRDVDDLTLGNVSASGAVSVAAGGDIRLTSDIAANAVTFESLTGSVLQSGGVLTVAAGPSAVVAPVSVILTQPGNVLGGGLTVTSPLSQVTGDVSSTTAAAVVGAVAATGTARLSPPDSADLPAEIALPGTAVPGGPGAAPDAEGLPGGVRVLSMPAIGAGEAARMLVLLDEAALGGGAPLRFGLSPEARAALDADAVLRARREDGSPLPSWLVFDGRTGEFTVNEEALSDLPGDVIVTDGRTSVALRIDLGGT